MGLLSPFSKDTRPYKTIFDYQLQSNNNIQYVLLIISGSFRVHLVIE